MTTLELLRAPFWLLLFLAAFCYGVSASANVTTVASLTTDVDTSKPGSESPSIEPDTGLNSTTDAPNASTDAPNASTDAPNASTDAPNASTDAPNASTSTSTSSRSSGTPMLPTVQTNASPPTILSSTRVRNVVCLILLFCFLILLFFLAFKWYVRNGRPSSAEIGRSLVECVRNIWAAAADLLRPSSKDIEEEHEDEEMAGIKMAEDQNNRGGDAEDDSDEDSSDYANVGGYEGTKKGEDMDGQGNEGEDEMSSVELKDETERMKDDLTVL